jgi:hypothetical protein
MHVCISRTVCCINCNEFICAEKLCAGRPRVWRFEKISFSPGFFFFLLS